MNEGFIRYVIGSIMIVAIYALLTTLMSLPFETGVVALVVVLYLVYTYFRHGRRG